MAAITGLEKLTRPCEVQLYSDSKYLTDAFNQHWIDGWLKKAGNEAKMNLLKYRSLETPAESKGAASGDFYLGKRT